MAADLLFSIPISWHCSPHHNIWTCDQFLQVPSQQYNECDDCGSGFADAWNAIKLGCLKVLSLPWSLSLNRSSSMECPRAARYVNFARRAAKTAFDVSAFRCLLTGTACRFSFGLRTGLADSSSSRGCRRWWCQCSTGTRGCRRWWCQCSTGTRGCRRWWCQCSSGPRRCISTTSSQHDPHYSTTGAGPSCRHHPSGSCISTTSCQHGPYSCRTEAGPSCRHHPSGSCISTTSCQHGPYSSRTEAGPSCRHHPSGSCISTTSCQHGPYSSRTEAGPSCRHHPSGSCISTTSCQHGPYSSRTEAGPSCRHHPSGSCISTTSCQHGPYSSRTEAGPSRRHHPSGSCTSWHSMELACHAACCSSSPVAPQCHPAPPRSSQSCRHDTPIQPLDQHVAVVIRPLDEFTWLQPACWETRVGAFWLSHTNAAWMSSIIPFSVPWSFRMQRGTPSTTISGHLIIYDVRIISQEILVEWHRRELVVVGVDMSA